MMAEARLQARPQPEPVPALRRGPAAVTDPWEMLLWPPTAPNPRGSIFPSYTIPHSPAHASITSPSRAL